MVVYKVRDNCNHLIFFQKLLVLKGMEFFEIELLTDIAFFILMSVIFSSLLR